MPSSFYLLAAGLPLFLLLSACSGNSCVLEGGGSQTPHPPMSSMSVFFLLAAGPPLLISPVLLELSSLNEPWYVDSLFIHRDRNYDMSCGYGNNLDHSGQCIAWRVILFFREVIVSTVRHLRTFNLS